MIDELLDLIADGAWHNESDIRNKLGIDSFRLRMLLNFLAEFNFVEYNTVMLTVRIKLSVQSFWRNIKGVER